jgi:hypothetical protein
VPLTASGQLGDPLTHEIWLPSKNRRETLAEFRVRVRDDLLDSIADFAENQLPRPALFAYPFSASRGSPPFTASGYANKFIHELFAAAMTNYVAPATPLSRREAATRFISRLEVTSADTAEMLFTRLRRTASLPTADASALAELGRWAGENGKPAGIAVSGKSVTFKSKHATWGYAAYAPGETADWDRYRISAEITQLNPQTDPSATLSVRLGSASQVNVNIANHYMEVRLGNVHSSATAVARALPASSAHRVSVQVRRKITLVFVDGRLIMRRAVPAGPASTGGFALSVFRPSLRRPFPRFSGVSLTRLAP